MHIEKYSEILKRSFSPQRRGVSSEEEEGEVDSEVELPRRRYLLPFSVVHVD